MLNYALVLALIVGVAFYGISELGQSVKASFDKVNAAITVVHDINNSKENK